MFFVYNPQEPSPVYFNPEDAYAAYRRREYIAALEEEQRRIQFERELALEEARHRRALAALAQQEAARRYRQVPQRFAPRRPEQHTSGSCVCGHNADACTQPDPQEIYRRRQARQEEEERLSREFHKNILTQIFGVPSEQIAPSTAQQPPIAPMSSILAQGKEQPKQEPKGTIPATKQSAAEAPTAQYSPDEEPEPHWSAVPERGRTLAEVTSISRAFESLKNTFVFPSGPLEAVSGSNPPRLSYNKINAPIHAYQHALSELVTKLDGIESYGFKGLREARKQLVVKIDEEMEQLDKKIMATLTSSSEQKQPTDTEPTEKPTSSVPATVAIPDSLTATNTALTENNESSQQTDDNTPPKEREDTEMGDTEPLAAEANKVLPGDNIYPEKPVAPSLSQVVVSTEVEPLEPQAANKETMDLDTQAPSDPGQISVESAQTHSQTTSPHLKAPTISVEEDSEIEDAVKTCSLA